MFEDALYELCLAARNKQHDSNDERQAAFQNIRNWLHDDRNPREAAAGYKNYKGDFDMPLHVLLAADPPLDLVKTIISFAPEAVGHGFVDEPKTIAEKNKAHDVVVDYLSKCKKLFELCQSARGASTLIERGDEFQKIRDWLNDDRNPREAAARYVNQEGSICMPLHVLLAADPPLELVKTIISFAPESVGQMGYDDLLSQELPIDIARNNQAHQDVIDYLTEYLSRCARPNALYALCLIARDLRDNSDEKRNAAFQNIRDWLNNYQNPREVAAHYINQHGDYKYSTCHVTIAGKQSVCKATNTPLHIIVAARPPLDLVEKIIQYAPEAPIISQGCLGSLPLHVACLYGASADVVEKLLRAGKSNGLNWGGADQEDFNGNLPLHLACNPTKSGRFDLGVIRKLLERYPEGINAKADGIHQKNEEEKDEDSGMTPLHVACHYRASVDLVKELLRFGCANHVDLRKRLPLHVACQFGTSVDVVQELLRAGKSNGLTGEALIKKMVSSTCHSTTLVIQQSLVVWI